VNSDQDKNAGVSTLRVLSWLHSQVCLSLVVFNPLPSLGFGVGAFRSLKMFSLPSGVARLFDVLGEGELPDGFRYKEAVRDLS
jgi:hypothetical protein